MQNLESSPTISCGIPFGKNFTSLVGRIFGRLTVESFVERKKFPSGQHADYYRCKCQCGNFTIASSKHLPTGHTKSCGCLNMEKISVLAQRLVTHGMTRTPEFKAWQSMNQRCYNPKCLNFNHYGGRGITVCERWIESFDSFLADVGFRPSPKHSLDRYPNQNGDYEPSNVRWATTVEQGRNRRSNRMLTVDGVTKGMSVWTEIMGFEKHTISSRLDVGWTVKDAVTRPLIRRKRKPK